MKANYKDNELVQTNKHRAKMYEEINKSKEIENAEQWTPIESGTELDAGMTLYDIAKQGAATAPPLPECALMQMQKDICDFVLKHPDHYYMLLCNERKDYTVLHTEYGIGWDLTVASIVQECLQNRGNIVEYEIQEQTGGIELWIRDEADDAAAYYFFPYGIAIIEC